nr:MAG TPA: hypothetical protein [Caudoviricetes sp.]DAJ24141.1 MAG TPA: hypothetical protein [Caudoviricetes sp.]
MIYIIIEYFILNNICFKQWPTFIIISSLYTLRILICSCAFRITSYILIEI